MGRLMCHSGSFKRKLTTLIIILLPLVGYGNDLIDDGNRHLRDELLQFLETDDFLGQGMREKHKEFLDSGDEVIPILAEIWEEAESFYIASRALSLMIEIDGRSEQIIGLIGRLLRREQEENDDSERLRISTIIALRTIAQPEDLDWLYPLLDDENWQVRTNVIRTLGDIGDEATIERLEHFAEKRRNELTQEKVNTDTFLNREVPDATKRIQARLLEEREEPGEPLNGRHSRLP